MQENTIALKQNHEC